MIQQPAWSNLTAFTNLEFDSALDSTLPDFDLEESSLVIFDGDASGSIVMVVTQANMAGLGFDNPF